MKRRESIRLIGAATHKLPLFIGNSCPIGDSRSASTVRLGRPGCCVSGPTAQLMKLHSISAVLDIGCAEPTYKASFLERASEFLMAKFHSDFSREWSYPTLHIIREAAARLGKRAGDFPVCLSLPRLDHRSNDPP